MNTRFDTFLSYAEPDRTTVAEPLAEHLKRAGVSVWFAPWEAKVGQSLRRLLDSALTKSRFGIIVLSPSFFGRFWPEFELDGLIQKEIDGQPVILPVWHLLNEADVRRHSPSLAGRIAARWENGVTETARSLIRVIKGDAVAELNATRALLSLAQSVEEYLHKLSVVTVEGVVVYVKVRAPDIVVIFGSPGGAGARYIIRDALRLSDTEDLWKSELNDLREDIELTVDVWQSLREW